VFWLFHVVALRERKRERRERGESIRVLRERAKGRLNRV
jgi:hypothetical protein